MRVNHGCKLAFHLILPQKPVVHLNLFALDDRAYNIGDTELMALGYVDVLGIVMLGQDEATRPLHDEVDADYLVSLVVHILEVRQ
jgi:hypothetical protein